MYIMYYFLLKEGYSHERRSLGNMSERRVAKVSIYWGYSSNKCI